MRLRWLVTAKIGLALATFASPAFADNTTVAEALFDSGRELFDQGKYKEACEKFEESQRLDPGTGTLLNLASCYEKAGRLASAWSTYRLAASSAASAGQTDRADHARQEAANLEGRLARVTLEIADEAKVEGLIILQDGTEQSTAISGVPLPVDAGAHEWEVSAPGHQGWRAEMTIRDGEQRVVKIPALIPEGQKSPTPPREEETPKEEEAAPREGRGGPSALKITGFALGGVGLVGIGVGSFFGITAMSKNADSNEDCDGNSCDRESAVELRDQALAAGNLSTVFFAVGLGALGAGVTLVLLAPKSGTEVSVAPIPGGSRLVWGGTF